ncbi:secreted protein/lipoprotein [Streptomyces sp. 21So2-11]|uniref:secreted protein/lipoprotein n=1 Tax=Streptomyces sp. 21So2-11 TaxID=3144408 RepID=UPI00321B205C
MTSQRPTKPAADPTETAKAEAVGTYKRYWQEMERVYATAKVEGTGIKKYAASTALSRTGVDTKRMQKTGRIFTGNVTVNDPTVTQIDLNRKIPNAKISSCLDVSRWVVVDRGTKKPVALPTKRLTKYIIVATVERWPEGWRVTRDEPQTGRPC